MTYTLVKQTIMDVQMAFERSILDYAFPIPSNVESHDLWFALVGNILSKNIHINDFTLLKRDHTNNTTKHYF